MTRPLIVLDTHIQRFQGNEVFDPAYAARFPGALATARLYKAVRQSGFDMITSDLYAAMRNPPAGALCISDRVTPFVRRQLQDGRLTGAILVNFESPNVDIRFYHTLRARSALFKHVFVFRGARERVAPGTTFHVAYFPQARRTVIAGPAWNDRDWLVMVAGNKQASQSQGTAIESRHPLKRLKKRVQALRHRWILLTDPMLRVEDLYRVRLEAAYFFSQRPGFRLFGTGWERKIYGVPDTYDLALRTCVGGPVDDKIAAMSRYRFSLCFENCIFPGYVTEKIFDCFFAGCIPVYYGAPDITDFVPLECFVDFRKFSSFAELEEFLHYTSPAEGARYLEAASSYLESPAFDRFHQDCFVEQVLTCVQNVI